MSTVPRPVVLYAMSEIAERIDPSSRSRPCGSWRELLTAQKEQMNVTNAVQKFPQTNGVNAILAFLPGYCNLLRDGSPLTKALLYFAAATLISCGGKISALFLVNRLERTKLLILGSIGLCVGVRRIGLIHFQA
jgi:hypothetical protein